MTPTKTDLLPTFCTLRDGGDEIHIECRFPDGQKYAAVKVENECEELALFLATAINTRTQPTADIEGLDEALNFGGDWASVEGYKHFRKLMVAARLYQASQKGAYTLKAILEEGKIESDPKYCAHISDNGGTVCKKCGVDTANRVSGADAEAAMKTVDKYLRNAEPHEGHPVWDAVEVIRARLADQKEG